MTSHSSIQNMMHFLKNTNGGWGRQSRHFLKYYTQAIKDLNHDTFQQNKATKLR